MDTSLDLLVSRALFSTRVLERALHDDGQWTLEWAGIEVPVRRTALPDGVTFSADFPEVCHLTEPYPVALLKVDGEVVSAKTIEYPGEVPFTVQWTMRARVVESVG